MRTAKNTRNRRSGNCRLSRYPILKSGYKSRIPHGASSVARPISSRFLFSKGQVVLSRSFIKRLPSSSGPYAIAGLIALAGILSLKRVFDWAFRARPHVGIKRHKRLSPPSTYSNSFCPVIAVLIALRVVTPTDGPGPNHILRHPAQSVRYRVTPSATRGGAAQYAVKDDVLFLSAFASEAPFVLSVAAIDCRSGMHCGEFKELVS